MLSSTRSNRRTRREWKDTYSVGIEALDDQHRLLLDLINKLGDLADAPDAVQSGAFGALNAMIRYAQNHFRTEESYFEKYSYPKYSQQKAEHDAFVGDTFSMAQALEESDLSFGSIILFLEDWYADHILGFDQGYKKFFASKMADEAKVASVESREKGAGHRPPPD